MCLAKMSKSIALTMLLVILTLLSDCVSSARYIQISFIDSAITNFLMDEEKMWNRIHAPSNRQNSQNATLTEILEIYQRDINQTNIANINLVQSINPTLAEHIGYINETQQAATQWLNERKYSMAQQFCEDIIKRVPNELSQIFEVTKSAAFSNYIRDNSDFCQTRRRIVAPGGKFVSLQNVVMDFYTAVPEALLKGYMTVQMAYMVLAIKIPKSKNQVSSSVKSYENKSVELRQWFITNHEALRRNVLSISKNFTGEIWNCDDFTKPFSYTQLTNFMQGYIENEVNFNRDGSCRGTCEDYQRVNSRHSCRNDTICSINYLDKNKTRCDGQIRSCTFFESDFSLCPNENDQISSRRYNYVRFSSGLLLGHSQFCPDEIKVKSWLRCVVTGIRFMKKDRMIHIFVAERKLGRNGDIIIDHNVEPYQSDYNFVIEDSGVKEGTDYHKLTWQNRTIELDTIRAPKGEVVTGARFRIVDNRLRFEIRTTAFDYESGQLSREDRRTTWRGNNDHNKEEIPIYEADVPTRSPHKSQRHRSVNKYIKFTPTDMIKDIAQSTVPFIDTQPVEAVTPKPLSGAGIYYKSSPGYGGFIAPLLVLYDFENDSL